MCGIVGIASADPVSSPEVLAAMRDTLRHRGPDDEGLWWSPDRRLGLGHRRLAILDLSPTGHQPMADPTGRLRISYNGELYNHIDLRGELEGKGHRFRGTSDTEVVLAAYGEWGPECLARFDGMFAFALHDAAASRLFLARDRVGEKPLFYRHAERRLVFASELKALLADPAVPRRLNLESLDHFLAYGYVPGERCILRGVRKLPAAHALVYEPQADSLRVWRYWRLPAPPPAVSEDTREGTNGGGSCEHALVDELEALLADSVRRRLVADVPVGVLLSGGIDSSLVAAAAARHSPGRVRTFTVTFPDDPDHDEGPRARLVARHLGTEHTEIPSEPASLDLLPALARQFDEPMADHSLIPTYLVSRAIRRHMKVALGGDGGDELFGGYPHYGWLAGVEKMKRFMPRGLRSLLGSSARRLRLGTRGRNHLLALGGDRAAAIAHVNLYFDAHTRRRLLAPLQRGLRPGAMSPEQWRAGLCAPGMTLLQQATRVDLQTTLVDGYLVKVDRASMLSSLEVRCPWLSHPLVEFAFGRVPDDLKVGRRGRKILPRRLAARLLPSGLDLERKQGLTMPLDRWLRTGGAAGLEAVLREADPSLFDPRVIGELLDLQRRGYRNAQRLFAVAVFELWRREYRVEVA
jgi:asparagine synthase (glutamine-hydrolysing)